ncbi:MAG: hypothetical protein AAF986_04575 [Pseudomonadota bacterium]
MRSSIFIFLVFISMQSFVHANGQVEGIAKENGKKSHATAESYDLKVVEAIKGMTVGGLNVFSSFDDVDQLMSNSGYALLGSNARSLSNTKKDVYQKSIYQKDGCRFEVSKRLSMEMMYYSCGDYKDQNIENNFIATFEALCSLSGARKENRAGCSFDSEYAYGVTSIESFEVKLEDKSKYTAKFNIRHHPDGTKDYYVRMVVLGAR